jgi:hypothetical protein
VTTHPEPTRLPASTRARTTCSLYLIALLTLAGAACSENASPTAPAAVEPAPTQPAAAVKAPRTPYISDVHLHSIYIDMGPDGTYDNGVDLVLTNPGPKAEGLYLWATVTDNHYTVDGGTVPLYCQAPEGILLRGTCRQLFVVTPPPHWLQLGPARLTIYLMQRGPDGSITALDRRTLDVVLVHS